MRFFSFPLCSRATRSMANGRRMSDIRGQFISTINSCPLSLVASHARFTPISRAIVFLRTFSIVYRWAPCSTPTRGKDRSYEESKFRVELLFSPWIVFVRIHQRRWIEEPRNSTFVQFTGGKKRRGTAQGQEGSLSLLRTVCWRSYTTRYSVGH